MVNQFLLNYINKQLDQGKNEEDIKEWLISSGLKPSDFDMEFEFLAHLGKLKSSDKHKVAASHDYLEKISGPEEHKIPTIDFTLKKRTSLQKMAPIIMRVSLSLGALLLAIIGINYFSKNMAGTFERTFSFAEAAFNKVFQSGKFAITSPWSAASNTAEISISSTSTIATSSLTIVADATSIIAVFENGTTKTATSADTIVGGTTTVATSETAVSVEDAPVFATSTETSSGQVFADGSSFIYNLNQARTLWNGGKYTQSLASAQTAFNMAGDDQEKAKAQYWIGLSYYSLGNKDESEQAELSAISLDQAYEPPYVTLSAIKLDQSDCDQAFIYADKALKLNPDDPWALNNSGLAYYCLGDKENAILQLQKAVALAPNSDVIWHNLNLYMSQI